MTTFPDNQRESRASAAGPEFDLHGLAGIRLVDASPRDVALVMRQLGDIRAPLARQPDITIRFVDRMPGADRMAYIGLNDAGFTEEAFYVVGSGRAVGQGQAVGAAVGPLARIPFDAIGHGCEIVCERGLSAVPYLIPILNLTVLANGGLPLHATAFLHEELGVMVMGWSKGGKTEALLAFAQRGARYVGDEWIYLSADGRRMFGLPEPIRLWDWQLRQMPDIQHRLSRGERARMAALRAMAATARGAARAGRGLPAGATLDRVAALLQRQLNVRVAPRRLFGPLFGPLESSLDRVVFIASHARPDTTVERIAPAEVADRMAASLHHERLPFLAAYDKFRFAFPQARNPMIEEAGALERERLHAALSGKPAIAAYHPYPVRIPSLYDEIAPALRAEANGPLSGIEPRVRADMRTDNSRPGSTRDAEMAT